MRQKGASMHNNRYQSLCIALSMGFYVVDQLTHVQIVHP